MKEFILPIYIKEINVLTDVNVDELLLKKNSRLFDFFSVVLNGKHE